MFIYFCWFIYFFMKRKFIDFEQNILKKRDYNEKLYLKYIKIHHYFKLDDLLFQIINKKKEKIEVKAFENGYIDLDNVLFNGFIIKESVKVTKNNIYELNSDIEVDLLHN